MTDFVLCVRDVNRERRFSTGLGKARFLAVPADAAEPLPEHALASSQRWLQAVLGEATGGAAEDVVFFVHGYNTDPAESLKRQRLAQQELRARGYTCRLVGFDWPTGGTAAAYAYDRMEAQKAALLLVEAGIRPFAAFQRPDCLVTVNLLAHSMGAFVVREAFRAADRAHADALAAGWKVGQLALFGADLSSGCFALDSPDMLAVFAHCGRLTNYFSGFDEALGVSNLKNLDLSSRVGRVGMPVDTPGHAKALDVDCGPRYQAVPDRQFQVIQGMVSHSWYLEDPRWYDDLALTLAGKVDRNLFPTRTKVGENDFVLKPA